MIDFKKYVNDEENISFLEDLRYEMQVSHSEVVLEYKGYTFSVEPILDKIEIYDNTKECVAIFDSFDDFLLNFKLEGKPFIELLDDIDYGVS